MDKEQVKKALSKYQSSYIICIIIIGGATSILTIVYLRIFSLIEWINLINIYNLFFRFLSQMFAVIIIIVVVDSLRYENLNKKSKETVIVKNIYNNNSLSKVSIFCMSLGFSLFMYLGNIRYWFVDLYKIDLSNSSVILDKIVNIEVLCLTFGVLSLIIGILLEIIIKFRQ